MRPEDLKPLSIAEMCESVEHVYSASQVADAIEAAMDDAEDYGHWQATTMNCDKADLAKSRNDSWRMKISELRGLKG